MDVRKLASLVTQPCATLRSSAALRLLLGQVLAVGNHLNQGTARWRGAGGCRKGGHEEEGGGGQ